MLCAACLTKQPRLVALGQSDACNDLHILYVSLTHSSLQVSYAAWAALGWTLNHMQHDTMGCITAVLDLLHDLLGSQLPDPAVDATQVCRLGLPILLSCMAGASARTASAQKLLMVLLDCLTCARTMDIVGVDGRLWTALQQLFTALCEILSLKLFCCWPTQWPGIHAYRRKCISYV